MLKTVKVEELPQLMGELVGQSQWVTIDQERINIFADVTEDHQFIHVNPELAKKSPFGTTIAHGFLSLSLLSRFSETGAMILEGTKMGLNYGFEKVRFLSPVKVGSRVRAHFTLKNVVEKNPKQFLLTYIVSVEIEGEDKPALVADWLVMQIIS